MCLMFDSRTFTRAITTSCLIAVYYEHYLSIYSNSILYEL